MDSRDIPQPQPQQFQPALGMLMSQFPDSTTGAMMEPNSASHHRLTFGSLTPHRTFQQQQQQQMDQKTPESLGYVEEVSTPSSQPMRSGIDQNQQQQVKKKRGRPRKYAPDGTIALGLAPTSPLRGDGDSGRVDPPAKRARGRPPGSNKKQLDASGTSVFTPHIIEVNEGEEILSKVAAFSNQGPRTVSVLSASGEVSTVTLRYPGGIHNYKGRFEIVALSGYFTYYEINGSIDRTGSLRVALASPSGQILGGLVGQLVAATPVQIIVASFVDEAKKLKQSTGNNAHGQNPEPASAPANMLNFGSNSQGPSSESSEENESGSPSMQQHDNNSHGIYGNSLAQQQQLRQMQMYNLWPSSGQ